MSSVFGSCKDKTVTWLKGFDENGCAIVTLYPAGVDPTDTTCPCPEGVGECVIPLGPFLKGVEVNGNLLEVADLIASMQINYVPYDPAVHVEGPLAGDGTAENPLQVPIKECNFEFTKFDPAVHVEGQPIQGDGTLANPWLIPVKECNFEYVPYDPAVHDEGPIEGDGSPANPWQIPFKECNFVYVPYDPAVHDAGPIEGDGSAANPWQVPVKECNFEFVAYDPATHVEGQPIPGEGTVASPWLIPLKECNFEFIKYDPAIHVEGQPVQGEGTVASPWLIPVKECNFVYVPYDPAVHDAGPVEGDGTVANPWQIPVKECNFVYVPYDPAVHDAGVIEGNGTLGSPWQIPVKECNFEYVPYNPAIHDAGVIEGTGTVADPWQIPVKECNFEYVPFNPAVHDAGAVEGDGTVANPWQIPFKECNFEYVPFNPAIHDAGAVEGDGTALSPWQIPLFMPDHNFIYVPYDPAIHGDTPDVEGDGSPENPWQIPLVIKECNFQYVPYDPAVHDPGLIAGDGTSIDPWQIPLPPAVSLPTFTDKAGNAISSGQLMQVTDFAAGTSAAGDQLLAQDAAGNCKLVPPKECNFVYVPYDAAIHDAGVIEGDGTVANPWQVPLPPSVQVPTFTNKAGAAITSGSLLQATDFVAGAVVTGDVILAQDASGNCKLVPYPQATAPTNFTDKNGQAITAGSLLLATDFAAGTVATGDQILAQDASGVCKLIPYPQATAPTNFTDKSGQPLTAGVLIQQGDFVAGPYADTDRVLVFAADGTCKSVQIPQALRKDGTPLDTAYTPLNIDSLTDLARPISADLGDKIIGQTASGDCELFDPPALNFNYVPFDPAIHDAGTIEGDGSTANPFQVPVKECNFEYVALDPAIHDAGPVEGDGSTSNPWEIPIKECNFEYVDFDPAIHGETDSGVSPIVGDGTVANPWEIPRPCCEEPVCPLPSAQVTHAKQDVDLTTLCTATGEPPAPEFSLLTNEVYGNVVGGSANPPVPQNITLNVPDTSDCDCLFVHLSWAEARTGPPRAVAQTATLSTGSAGVGPAQLQVDSDLDWFQGSQTMIYKFDVTTGAAGTLDLAFDPASYVTDNQGMLIISTYCYKGPALTDNIVDYNHQDRVENSDGIPFTRTVTHAPDPDLCPIIYIQSGRHIDEGAQSFGGFTVVPDNGGTFTEVNEYVPYSGANNNECQLGHAAGIIFDANGYDSVSVPNFDNQWGGPVAYSCRVDCANAVAEPTEQVLLSCPVTATLDPCNTADQDLTVSVTAPITIDNVSGSSDIDFRMCVDGVEVAPAINSSGTLSYTGIVGSVSPGGTLGTTVEIKALCNGLGDATTDSACIGPVNVVLGVQ